MGRMRVATHEGAIRGLTRSGIGFPAWTQKQHFGFVGILRRSDWTLNPKPRCRLGVSIPLGSKLVERSPQVLFIRDLLRPFFQGIGLEQGIRGVQSTDVLLSSSRGGVWQTFIPGGSWVVRSGVISRVPI